MAHTSRTIPRKEPYVPKVTKSVILVCKACTKRYIKTRTSQDACLQCFIKSRDLKAKIKR